MTVRALLPVNPDGGQEPSGSGEPGPPGQGVPTGGATGQSLVKSSNTNYATTWESMATLLALGEVANEVADLVAALGDEDQIGWLGEWGAAGEATGASGSQFLGFLTSSLGDLGSQVGAAQADASAALGNAATATSTAADALAAADAAASAAQDAADLASAAQATADVADLNAHHISFDINATTMTPLSEPLFGTLTLQANAYNGAVRTSTGDVDASVSFPLPGPMYSNPGLWTFTLTHFTGPDCGIYSIETTPDGGFNWDVVGTVDGYAAVGAAAEDNVVGVAVPDPCDQIRVRMATKNPSSLSFVGHISALSGVFIFT